MKNASQSGKDDLKRELGAPLLTIYGIGTILGAGIYVLIGKVVGEGGHGAPLSFLLAGIVALVNGLVYAELSTRQPSAGGPSSYVENAFGKKWLTVSLGWMITITGVVSAATIAAGFSGYVTQYASFPEWISRVALIVVLCGVASAGAKESAWFMAITTALGVIGLGYVMYAGFFSSEATGFIPTLGQAVSFEGFGAMGVLSAAFLAVYSFIGFEDMVHMAEEVKKPRKAMPVAIIVAITVAAALYFIISVAALSLMTPEALNNAKAPLVEVVEAAGYPGLPLFLLSIWVILNGALAQLIMATRVIYSMGNQSGAPSMMGKVNAKTHTPVRATALAGIVAIVMTVCFPLKTLASITSFVMLLVFAASNAALIILERRKEEAPFDVPKWLPWVGIVLCLILMVATFFVDGGGH